MHRMLKLVYMTFQLTASRRGWRFISSWTACNHSFQLTASRRGWPCAIPTSPALKVFQLTASRRGWLYQNFQFESTLNFNSQPHEEADGTQEGRANRKLIFQLTASRRGWRYSGYNSDSFTDISTHSLTKRLTVLTDFIKSGVVKFQLTASRRGWPTSRGSSFRVELFQLTASRRGWREKQLRFEAGKSISTHSLTKRLTLLASSTCFCLVISTHSLTKRLTKTWIL